MLFGLDHRELDCLFHEPHTGLEDCLRVLLSCFRKRMSDSDHVLFDSVLRADKNDLNKMSVFQLVITNFDWIINLALKILKCGGQR